MKALSSGAPRALAAFALLAIVTGPSVAFATRPGMHWCVGGSGQTHVPMHDAANARRSLRHQSVPWPWALGPRPSSVAQHSCEFSVGAAQRCVCRLPSHPFCKSTRVVSEVAMLQTYAGAALAFFSECSASGPRIMLPEPRGDRWQEAGGIRCGPGPVPRSRLASHPMFQRERKWLPPHHPLQRIAVRSRSRSARQPSVWISRRTTSCCSICAACLI